MSLNKAALLKTDFRLLKNFSECIHCLVGQPGLVTSLLLTFCLRQKPIVNGYTSFSYNCYILIYNYLYIQEL